MLFVDLGKCYGVKLDFRLIIEEFCFKKIGIFKKGRENMFLV